MTAKRAALWVRVSTSEQETANQLPVLREWAENRGYEVAKVYDVTESAYSGKHQDRLNEALDDARLGKYQVLFVWALDRLNRDWEIESTLKVLRLFRERGVQVLSRQEDWTDVPADMQPLLNSIFAWMAGMESKRRSERVKAGLARAQAEGKGRRGPDAKEDAHKVRTKAQTARRIRESLAAK